MKPLLLLKISKSLRNVHDLDTDPFFGTNPGSGSASKLKGHVIFLCLQEVASEAARARRQRELELEVLTGTVREWEGEPIDQLGDIIKMGPVVVGPEGDRYRATHEE